MPINFHPGYGTLLYCDFSHQQEPEMVKSRPVIVVSRKNGNCKLCTVVPLSGTEPEPVQPWHHQMITDRLPNHMQSNTWWAKCDCIASVSFERLDRMKIGKNPQTGERIYIAPKVSNEDLMGVKLAIINHLGMLDLIPPKK